MYEVNNFVGFMEAVGSKEPYTSVDEYMARVITMDGQLAYTKYPDKVELYFDRVNFELFMREEVCSWTPEDRKDLYNNWYVVWEGPYHFFKKGEVFCSEHCSDDLHTGVAVIKSVEVGQDNCIEYCECCSKGATELVFKNKKYVI